jgi:hypothetical protein
VRAAARDLAWCISDPLIDHRYLQVTVTKNKKMFGTASAYARQVARTAAIRIF